LLAIIKLSKGELWRLREWVQKAREDFRDVIFAAQNPEEMRLRRDAMPFGLIARRPSKMKKIAEGKLIQARRRDRQQWEDWLRGGAQTNRP
jgi:hypothetical protein